MIVPLNKIIHSSFRTLGITEDDDKRAIYARVSGKTGLTVMTNDEKQAVADELRRMGAQPADRRPNGQAKLSGRFAKKLQALWIACWNLGIVDNRDDAALTAFVKRQTGLDAVRFVAHADDATAAIEALKAWMARKAKVHFGPAPREWLEPHGARIAWAQWKILHPDADLISNRGFNVAVFAILGLPVGFLLTLTDEQWRTVMNALGERVRAEKGGA